MLQTILRGQAKLTGPHSVSYGLPGRVDVGGTATAKDIIIATGEKRPALVAGPLKQACLAPPALPCLPAVRGHTQGAWFPGSRRRSPCSPPLGWQDMASRGTGLQRAAGQRS